MSSTSPSADRDPAAMSLQELLGHIAGRYQETRRRDLPDLVALARKVEAVHHDVPEAPIGLADALDRMALELDLHMQVEESVLFPAMLSDAEIAIAHPLAVMRCEHEGYQAKLAKLEELARCFVLPEGACGSWRRLYEGVALLCEDLREQIHVENDILFPRFELLSKPHCTCSHSEEKGSLA